MNKSLVTLDYLIDTYWPKMEYKWNKLFPCKYTYNMNELKEFTNNKRLCLIGTALSIFNSPKNIDDYDVVCRINQAFPLDKKNIPHKTFAKIVNKNKVVFWGYGGNIPQDKLYDYRKYLGSRTDILFTGKNERQAVDTKFLVWTTYSIGPRTDWLIPNMKSTYIAFGQKDWVPLAKQLQSRPSTGIISLYFIVNYLKFKELTIFGMDFFTTENWNRPFNRDDVNQHDWQKEKEYVMDLVKNNNNIKIVMDM